jgi:hypothetical protein
MGCAARDVCEFLFTKGRGGTVCRELPIQPGRVDVQGNKARGVAQQLQLLSEQIFVVVVT